jgi:queuosine precursor transporter
MLQVTAEGLIGYLTALPPEMMIILNILFCYIMIGIMLLYFGISGMFVYISIAIIAANLQVLSATDISWYAEPIALGTVTYASTFLASDVITEIYGARDARKSVFLSFAAALVLIILMVITLGTRPVDEHSHFKESYDALKIIFNPNIAILLASFSAYIISQLTDIYIFSKIKDLSQSKNLWFRTLIAISIAAFIDSVIFNILAWKIFAPNPVSTNSLIYSYILSGYSLQMMVVMFNIPIFYLLLKLYNFRDRHV